MAVAGSLSFPKGERLMRAPDFENVKRNGSARRGKLLILSILPVEDAAPFRVGFVASRRVGGAVVRNRIRRRLREIVRRHQHGVRKSLWMVVVAREDAARASYRALEDEWLRLARRASILTA